MLVNSIITPQTNCHHQQKKLMLLLALLPIKCIMAEAKTSLKTPSLTQSDPRS